MIWTSKYSKSEKEFEVSKPLASQAGAIYSERFYRDQYLPAISAPPHAKKSRRKYQIRWSLFVSKIRKLFHSWKKLIMRKKKRLKSA